MKIFISANYLKVTMKSEAHIKAVNEACLRLRLTKYPITHDCVGVEGKKETLYDFLFLLAKDYDIDLI